MSRAQGDSYRTHTNSSLNTYYAMVFLPKYREALNHTEKTYSLNGGKIVCESENVVETDGWRLKGLKRTGEKRFTLRVYSDEGSSIADVVEVYTDKDKANAAFIRWKIQLSVG